MTRRRKIFIIIIGLHFSIFSFGQIAPSGLGSKNIQQEILDHTRTYDSLVLFNKSGFWNNNDVVKGFLFKKDGCYKVSILFRKKNELDFIKKINIEKEQVNDTIKVFLTTNFLKWKYLNSDSLHIKTKTNLVTEISDGQNYSILFVFPKKETCLYLDSYEPEFYQENVKTSDRQIFIDIFEKLKSYIN